MKKIVLFIAAIAFLTAAQSQVVIGLHGGYYQQNSTSTLNDDYQFSSNWLCGLRVGYFITPKLSVYVTGATLNESTANLTAIDSINFQGQPNVKIHDHKFTTARSGWMVSPELEYEFLKYGNMHFNIILGATMRQMGYTGHTESFITDTWPNPNEYQEYDPYVEQVKDVSFSVALRPSLTYEFSRHLSAELMLDFLSVGYVVDKVTDEANEFTNQTTVLYAGVNTLNRTLDWEAPVFRLGFNWKF